MKNKPGKNIAIFRAIIVLMTIKINKMILVNMHLAVNGLKIINSYTPEFFYWVLRSGAGHQFLLEDIQRVMILRRIELVPHTSWIVKSVISYQCVCKHGIIIF